MLISVFLIQGMLGTGDLPVQRSATQRTAGIFRLSPVITPSPEWRPRAIWPSRAILQQLRTKQIDVATAARRLTAGPGRIPELVEDKDTVVQFVKRQLRNTRKQVAKKAERFLRARVATHDAG